MPSPTPPAQSGANSPGAAVVLPVPPRVAVATALPEGGVAAGELHLTLAYLPEVDRADAVTVELLRSTVAGWAAGVPAPIAATLGGVGRFTGPADEGDAFVALVDAPGLGALREGLVAALTAAGLAVSTAHGFTPHVTLAYLGADAEPPLDRLGPVALTFEGVEVWRGESHDRVATFQPPDTTTMHRNLTATPTCYGAPVQLSIPPTDAEGGPWSTVAYAVELKGYKLKAGGHARITESDIDDMIRNFGAYPKAPLVIEHADTRKEVAEVHPEWAKPHGHVVELRKGTFTRAVKGIPVTVPSLEARFAAAPDVRLAINGDPDNGVPPTWPFCSITPAAGHDDEHDVPLGCVLWSVSLTAHPRLVDLPRIAASRRLVPMKNRTARRGGATQAPASIEPLDPGAEGDVGSPLAAATLGYWYGEIKTRGDVLSMLRSVFDLPVLTVEADVVAKLATLETLAATPEDISGVDVDDIVCSLRRALGLDALKTTAEVIASVRLALTSLPDGGAELSRATPTPHTPPPAANAAPTQKEPTTMKTFMELAAEHKIPAANEDQAREAVLALAREGATVRAALKVELGAPLAPALAAVAEDRAELGKVRESVKAVTAERDAALAKVKEVADAAAAAKAAQDLADLTSHVDAVALSKGWDEDTKALVLNGAKADPAAFAAKHPKPSVQELAQRAQDKERLQPLNLGQQPRTTGEGVANGAPQSGAAKLDADIAQIRSIALECGQPLDEVTAAQIAFRMTPAEYAAQLGVQL